MVQSSFTQNWHQLQGTTLGIIWSYTPTPKWSFNQNWHQLTCSIGWWEEILPPVTSCHTWSHLITWWSFIGPVRTTSETIGQRNQKWQKKLGITILAFASHASKNKRTRPRLSEKFKSQLVRDKAKIEKIKRQGLIYSTLFPSFCFIQTSCQKLAPSSNLFHTHTSCQNEILCESLSQFSRKIRDE